MNSNITFDLKSKGGMEALPIPQNPPPSERDYSGSNALSDQIQQNQFLQDMNRQEKKTQLNWLLKSSLRSLDHFITSADRYFHIEQNPKAMVLLRFQLRRQADPERAYLLQSPITNLSTKKWAFCPNKEMLVCSTDDGMK